MHRELITFAVGGQAFALDVMTIREIRAWTQPTRLPRAPQHIAGAVNMRGTVLPVIDLAARLGWEVTQATPRHVIIVAQLGGQTIGLIVDSVSDIVIAAEADIQPPPAATNDRFASFLEGLVAVDERMVMLIDPATLSDGGEQDKAA